MTRSGPSGKPRLRVAVLNRQFVQTGGGAERYSISLVEELAAACEIHVFAQQIVHDFPGVSYHRIPTLCRRPRWVNQLWFAALTWWKTRTGFDVVHSHEMTWHGQVQTIHVVPIKKSVLTGKHGLILWRAWLKTLTSPRLLVYLGLDAFRFQLRHGKVVVATSDSMGSTIQEVYPATRNHLQVVTPGIQRVHGPSTTAAKRSARLELKLPIDGRCLLFVANDYRKKGLPTLLHALVDQHSTTFLAVVGNPSHIPHFRDVAVKLGVLERVHFLGHRMDMDTCFVAADCLVHPTLEDTYAMVVLEAMSHGLPVIVSGPNHCGISSELIDGRNAVVIDRPEDARALGGRIAQVLNNASLRDRLSQGSVEFAARQLWSGKAAQQLRIYQGLTGHNGLLP